MVETTKQSHEYDSSYLDNAIEILQYTMLGIGRCLVVFHDVLEDVWHLKINRYINK